MAELKILASLFGCKVRNLPSISGCLWEHLMSLMCDIQLNRVSKGNRPLGRNSGCWGEEDWSSLRILPLVFPYISCASCDAYESEEQVAKISQRILMGKSFWGEKFAPFFLIGKCNYIKTLKRAHQSTHSVYKRLPKNAKKGRENKNIPSLNLTPSNKWNQLRT